MPSIGSHCILELHDCPAELLDDKERVIDALRSAATKARATLLGEVAHRFEPQGVTALALLAESHISMHTWPELGYAACDVFTCGETCEPEQACMLLIEAMQAGRYDLRRFSRGGESPSIRPARAPKSEVA